MEAPEQVSEPPAHYMTPTADTPDRQRYQLLVDPVNLLIWTGAGFWQSMHRCDCAAAALLLLNEDEDNWIRLHGKGTEWWEAGRNYLLGRYEASGGVRRNRLAKEGGLNEEDNWTRLHGSVQRGGVGGYLILAIGA
eukprot:scaffold33185_cov69-Attheya_sp.AAC.2